MKKLLTILVLVFSVTTTFAQQTKNSKYVDGIMITNDGDSLSVTFKVFKKSISIRSSRAPKVYYFPESFKYMLNGGDKWLKGSTDDTEQVIINYNKKEFVFKSFHSRKNATKGIKYFYRKVISGEGELDLYYHLVVGADFDNDAPVKSTVETGSTCIIVNNTTGEIFAPNVMKFEKEFKVIPIHKKFTDNLKTYLNHCESSARLIDRTKEDYKKLKKSYKARKKNIKAYILIVDHLIDLDLIKKIVRAYNDDCTTN